MMMLDAVSDLFRVKNFLCLDYINVLGFVKVVKCEFAFTLLFSPKRNA